MRVIAFDQSLANTGYAVFDLTQEPVLVEYGPMKTAPNEPLIERLITIEQACIALFHKHNPTYVFTELVFTPRGGRGDWPSLLKVELIIHRLVHIFDLKLLIVPAATRRRDSWRYILGITSTNKSGAKAWALANGVLPPNTRINEHVGDAIAIGFAGLSTLNLYSWSKH